jgi:hypothetical protein
MVWRADMRRFEERFRAAPQNRDYFAFLKGTDGLLHIRGRDRLDVALESLDKILRDIQSFCGRETEVVLFSDHGMSMELSRRVHLQTHLRRHGYEIATAFNGRARRRAVALPAFGLIGYAALFCSDEEEAARIADSLVELEGVDFSLRREGASAVVVRGGRGTARIDRRDDMERGTLYRYEQVAGDPLMLAEASSLLGEAGKLDAQGYAADAEWLVQTAHHVYPDALSNLYESIRGERVRHHADLLVSLQDGYYYGSSVFSRFVRLAATHGNALRASTSAFMMSTHRQLPAAIRASHAQPILRG